MDLLLYGPEWVQAGELGLAFIVIFLCSGLVLFVMKSSAKREQELLSIITKVLPVMESMSASMVLVNQRLEHIEENMGTRPVVTAPKKSTPKRRKDDKAEVDK